MVYVCHPNYVGDIRRRIVVHGRPPVQKCETLSEKYLKVKKELEVWLKW
jgi:hypothetical protein